MTLELVNGVIWTENNQNKWYEAVGTGWTLESTGPPIGSGQAANLTGAVTRSLARCRSTPRPPTVTAVAATRKRRAGRRRQS